MGQAHSDEHIRHNVTTEQLSRELVRLFLEIRQETEADKRSRLTNSQNGASPPSNFSPSRMFSGRSKTMKDLWHTSKKRQYLDFSRYRIS